MAGRNALKLEGAVFGTLKVIQRWGLQSSNLAWVYHCRSCGHHGKRLGITLKTGTQACPLCRETKRRGNRAWPFPDPDPDQVDAVMRDAPLVQVVIRRGPLTVSKPLKKCTRQELLVLLNRVEAELRGRPK